MFPLFAMSVLLNSMSVSVRLLFMGKAAPGLGGIMLSTRSKLLHFLSEDGV